MAQELNLQPIVMGTAGHIDHGKTALIQALTGIDTDRLPEERARGMTIDLGFAYMDVAGRRLGIVDVPGHERFVRTMVAGASGIDMVLLVVAADDSVMPQTREHVEILDLLGVDRGVIAITKTDLAEPDMVEMVAQEVGELLADTCLADSAMVRVSTVTGAGIDDLRQAIGRVVQRFAADQAVGPFRLHVDRVFTIAGRGTVVTGTVRSGRLESGRQVVLLPAGRRVRVRGIQSHGRQLDSVQRGQRAALNLAGIATDQIQRGDDLATDAYFEPAKVLDVEIRLLASVAKPLRGQSMVRLLLGTRELMARVVLLGAERLAPGRRGLAQLRLRQPAVAAFGQRFIIRDETAARTIGGGRVLRPVARRLSRRHSEDIAGLEALQSGPADQRLAEVIRYAGFDLPTPEQMAVRAGLRDSDEVADLRDRLVTEGTVGTYAAGAEQVLVHRRRVELLLERLERSLTRFHQDEPLAVGMPESRVLELLGRWGSQRLARRLLEELLGTKRLIKRGQFCCLADFRPALKPELRALQDQMVREIAAARFQPPAARELSCAKSCTPAVLAELLVLAVADGKLVGVNADLYLASEMFDELRDTVRRLVGQSGSVTVSELRAALGSTRKYVVPLVEYLDSINFTRRVGDKRVLADAATD